MVNQTVYFGLSAHWGLEVLRQRLAEPLSKEIVRSWVGIGRRSGGALQQRNTADFRKIDKAIQSFFATLTSETHARSNPSPYGRIFDAVIDPGKLFLHTMLSTGADKVVYHGLTRSMPECMSEEKARAVLGDRFSTLPEDIVYAASEEVSLAFPQLLHHRPDLETEEVIQLQLLRFHLIDLKVSLSTGARLISFYPAKSLATAAKVLPLDVAIHLRGALSLFEQVNAPALTPVTNADFALSGVPENLLSSSHFRKYCLAHDLINSSGADLDNAISCLSSSVIDITNKFQGFSKKNTLNLLIVKSADRLASIATGGMSSHVKDFFQILVQLSKDNQKRIAIYTGDSFAEFCHDVAIASAIGKHVEPAWWKRLFRA